ncbi:MAG TPA: NUDIX hydrolase [Candidatus Saccharimonadales bacterium]|nr:NUDIX hydrolase [Candidatus Saccharimonadales bacterium]
MHAAFNGVKVALIKGDDILVIQRDNKPGLQYAGMWDLPGGGREGDETSFHCAAREIHEELGIALRPRAVQAQKAYPVRASGHAAYFMVATITDEDIDHIVFGDEGQGWKMMPIEDFMASPNVVGVLKTRLQDLYCL